MAKRIPPLTRQTLRGPWAALILPWSDSDELDEKRFAQEVRSYGGTGVYGVYTGGTTGEFYTQDDATFERVAKIVCDEAHAVGLPVQIGVTALSTRVVRQRIRVALQAGAEGVQAALPFWLELKDDEVKRFVREVAGEAGAVPFTLYLTLRSKRKIAPELLGELAAECPTFIGIKDTGLDVAGVAAVVKAAPGLAVFGGEDFFEKMQVGGRGGYSSVTGLNARKVAELYELCAAGRWGEARPLAELVKRYIHECLIPMLKEDGLWDSAIDRVQRVAGGGVVGLRCQSPYRSATPAHVERLLAWCRKNAPELLPVRQPAG